MWRLPLRIIGVIVALVALYAVFVTPTTMLIGSSSGTRSYPTNGLLSMVEIGAFFLGVACVVLAFLWPKRTQQHS